MPPGARVKRQASIEDLKVLAHPARWRILGLCLDQSLTNQQIAERLTLSPATTLRHVRALAAAGFLIAEPVRPGSRGSREQLSYLWSLAARPIESTPLKINE